MTETAPGPRTVFWLDETHEHPDHPGWFVPNLVTEGEAGYQPLAGADDQSPWLWGPGIAAAKAACIDANADVGIDRLTSMAIVLSSMIASR